MSRLEWILGILLVVLLVAVLGISALIWFRPQTPALPEGLPPTRAAAVQPVPTSIYAEKTAMVAYATAQRALQDWYGDAVLLDATATWPQGVTETTLRTGEANWAYTFYSPAQSAMTLVTVRGDQASRIAENAYNQLTPLADTGSWLLDSQQAINKFMDEGAAQFLQNEGPSTMIMKLTATDNQMVWFMSLFANGSGRSFTMEMHANTGEVLALEVGP